MIIQHKSEKGQALIFIVIGFVVILGFVGLAIDGGRVYSDRRHAQNSADAASLAGGAAAALTMENSRLFYDQYNCGGDLREVTEAAYNAAIARAASNGFVIDRDVTDFHGVKVECGVDYSTGFEDKYMDVIVDLTTVTQAYFAQFFSNESLTSQVTATTRVRPRIPFAWGHAVVAMGKQDCSGNKYGTIFGGTSEVNIVGGGVFSNGCMNGNGQPFNVTVTGGTLMYAGQLDPGNGDWSYQNGSTSGTYPQHALHPLPDRATEIPHPDCNDPRAHHVTTLKESDFPLKEEGLWCVDGTADVKINGGEICAVDCNNPGRVTIVFEHGDVEINGGNALVKLSSPENTPDPSPGVPGLLFYLAEGSLELTGNNTTYLEGTIYAPNGEIKMHGTAGMQPTFNTQLVGEHVDVTGNYDLDIVFDQGRSYQIPTCIELNR